MKRTFKRSIDFGKKHWIPATLSVLISSLMPVLIEWHAEKQTADAIADVRSECRREIDQLKADQAARDKAQWEAIGRKKDKQP